jgi:hypothetical protein
MQTYPYSLFYHSIVLCLNRHFLPAGHFPVHEPSEAACAASCDQVVTLLRQFRNQHGSISPSLMLIYAIVLTAVILSTTTCKCIRQTINFADRLEQYVDSDNSKIWDLDLSRFSCGFLHASAARHGRRI